MISSRAEFDHLGVEFETPHELDLLSKAFYAAVADQTERAAFLRAKHRAVVRELNFRPYEPPIKLSVPLANVPKLAVAVLDIFENNPDPIAKDIAALAYSQLDIIVGALDESVSKDS